MISSTPYPIRTRSGWVQKLPHTTTRLVQAGKRDKASRNQRTTRTLGTQTKSCCSQIVELESTKQKLIYELATKSDNGKPTGGENESPAGTSFGGKYDKANKWQFWRTPLCRVMRNSSTILPKYAIIVHEKQNNDRQIRFIVPIRYSNRSISSTAIKLDHTSKSFHGRAELDSHADTTVVGRNCTILNHTERSCDVETFSDTYDPMKYVDIVLAAI